MSLNFNVVTNHTELYIDRTNYTTKINNKISQTDLETYLTNNYFNKTDINYTLTAYALAADLVTLINTVTNNTNAIVLINTNLGVVNNNLDTVIGESSVNKSNIIIIDTNITSINTLLTALTSKVGINETNLDVVIGESSVNKSNITLINTALNSYVLTTGLTEILLNYVLSSSMINYKTILSFDADKLALLNRIDANTDNIGGLFTSVESINSSLEYQNSFNNSIQSQVNLCIRLHENYYFDVSDNFNTLFINGYYQGRNIKLIELGFDTSTEVFKFKVNGIDIFNLINETLKIADLTDALISYVSTTALNTKLSDYKTNTAFTSAMTAYKTIASFNTDMNSYKTKTSFDSDLLLYQKTATMPNMSLYQLITGMSSYKTVASFNTDTSNFLGTSTFNTAMLDYVKIDALTTLLASYMRTADFTALTTTSTTNTTNINNNTGAITTISNSVSTNTTDISTLNTSVSTNSTDITNLKTRVTTTETNITNLTSRTETNETNITALGTNKLNKSLNEAWNGTTGQIHLYNGTANYISFSVNGANLPTVGSRSYGTKIVIYPGVSANTVDTAIGLENDALWYSVGSTSLKHRWYTGVAVAMTLSNNNLTLPGTITVTGAATVGSLTTAGNISAANLYNKTETVALIQSQWTSTYPLQTAINLSTGKYSMTLSPTYTPFYLAGKIAADGSIISTKGKYTFNVTKGGNGSYSIIPSLDFDNVDFIISVTTQIDGATSFARINNSLLTVSNITIATYVNNVSSNCIFHFTVFV